MVKCGDRRHMVMRQIFSGGAAALALVVTAPVAVAQDGAVGKRVDRLEKQMRAVQRSVFPGGNPAFFEGEIAPDNSPGERVKRSEEHTSELQSLMRISYAVFCLKKKKSEVNTQTIIIEHSPTKIPTE